MRAHPWRRARTMVLTYITQRTRADRLEAAPSGTRHALRRPSPARAATPPGAPRCSRAHWRPRHRSAKLPRRAAPQSCPSPQRLCAARDPERGLIWRASARPSWRHAASLQNLPSLVGRLQSLPRESELPSGRSPGSLEAATCPPSDEQSTAPASSFLFPRHSPHPPDPPSPSRPSRPPQRPPEALPRLLARLPARPGPRRTLDWRVLRRS